MCKVLPATTTGQTLFWVMILLFIFCNARLVVVESARLLLIIQSCSPNYDPDEQWWKRLFKQLGKLPGQSRLDIFLLRMYVYWPWLLITPCECFWSLLRRIVR